MWTKPAGSPRGLTSQVPSAEDVASSMNGDRSMNWRVSSLTLSLIFDWTTGRRRADHVAELCLGGDRLPHAAYVCLTAAISFTTESLASPNSIVVCGSR